MSNDLTKKAIEMLLKGATLVSDPCPYCKGVRIIKNGNALCVNCGKEGKEDLSTLQENQTKDEKSTSAIDKLDEKLKQLTEELEREKDYEKQQQILRSMNDIISVKEKLKRI